MAKKNMKERSVDVAVMGAGTTGIGAARTATQHDVSVALINGGPYGTLCARR